MGFKLKASIMFLVVVNSSFAIALTPLIYGEFQPPDNGGPGESQGSGTHLQAAMDSDRHIG